LDPDKLYRQIFLRAGWGIAVLEGERILMENPCLRAMRGLEGDTPSRRETRLTGLFPPEDRPAWKRAVREASETGRSAFESEQVRADGSRFAVRVELTRIDAPAPSGDGHLLAAAIFDISEQKRKEEERDLLESQLIQAQKLESFGLLAGGIAHDFNNLLSTIIGFSDLVISRLPEDDPCLEHLRHIHEAGMKGAALTRQILTFSKRQAKKASLTDCREILDGMLGMLSRLLGEHVSITLDCAPGHHAVTADQGQIEQVIMNLAINAAQAIGANGRIGIHLDRRDIKPAEAEAHGARPGRFVRIRFEDNGRGISPDILPRIFEPFFSTRTDEGGTGLGLATVRAIVARHQGFITVESTPGEGTRFHIHLPMAREDTVRRQPENQTARRPGGRETILVVEDDDQVRGFIIEAVRHEGYQPLSAASGEQAAELLADSQVDLVLSDIVMEGMNGVELAGLVRERHPRTKVLLMSGYTDDILARHGADTLKDDILCKPITPADLLHHIRAALDEPGGQVFA